VSLAFARWRALFPIPMPQDARRVAAGEVLGFTFFGFFVSFL